MPSPTLTFEVMELENRIPLMISRGLRTKSQAVWVKVAGEGAEGWGEAGEFGLGDVAQRLPQIEAGLEAARAILARAPGGLWDREFIERELRLARVGSSALAAIDQALWDWAGKRAGVPVWKLWGVRPDAGPLTFVTVGIGDRAAVQLRVRQWLEVGDVRAFKIKLGAPAGIAADQAMFEAVREAIPPGSLVSVDANGGWSPGDAATMCAWLAERGVDHVEQPLPRGREGDLPALRARSPLPLLLDESIFCSADLPPLLAQGGFDGINIKLMKCGGPSEARRMVAVARAFGLKTMIGCYYHTSLGDAAGAALGPQVDYLDLDSHLNLKADPFRGPELVAGRLVQPDAPGFGVTLR